MRDAAWWGGAVRPTAPSRRPASASSGVAGRVGLAAASLAALPLAALLIGAFPGAGAAAVRAGAVVAAGAQSTDGAAHLVVVTGLGGEPAYAEAFEGLALRLLEAARERWGLPEARAVWLADDPSRAPDRIAGRSTVERLAAELEALAGRAAPADRVLLVLIGHGSARDGTSTLNLPGPDLTGERLAELLAPLGDRRVAVVNAASASGGFARPLAGPNRIVITATASPGERERTRFGSHFVEALAEEGADADRDGRVSLLEAFEYARREVARAFEAGNQIRTEHALLEDDGDGVGSREPDPAGGDGILARGFFLGGPAADAAVAEAAAEDPDVAALLAEKRRLEGRVAALRAEKDELEPEAYERRLEALLLELARTTRTIRERTGGGP